MIILKYRCTIKIEAFERKKGGTRMIQFEKELEKFKPMLDINHIEENITLDDTKDMVDFVKEIIKTTYEQGN